MQERDIIENRISTNAKSGFIWNLLASATYSGTTVVLLWIVVRVCGVNAGGIFSITFSSAQMLQAIGFFGVRNFQVSDAKPEFSFDTYISSRILYVTAMLVICFSYGLAMGYTGEKLWVFYAISIVKAVETLADVFEGLLQQQDRMDLAAKALFARSVFALMGFIAVVISSENLILSIFAMLIGTVMGTVFVAILPSREFITSRVSLQLSEIRSLTKQCLPLFLSVGFMMYLVNASKIAIDFCLDSEIQASFGIIFSPALIVNLFCGFFFRPFLSNMSSMYNTQEFIKFKSIIKKLIGLVFLISVFVLAATYYLGIPLLSFVYGITLSSYKTSLMITILGGCFSALINLFSIVLVVIRKQKLLFFANGFVSCIVLFSSTALVRQFGAIGAAGSYLLSMALLASILFAFYLYYTGKRLDKAF